VAITIQEQVQVQRQWHDAISHNVVFKCRIYNTYFILGTIIQLIACLHLQQVYPECISLIYF